MSKLVHVGRELFRKYPLLSNSTVYGTLCVGAEFSQQYLTKRILADPTVPAKDRQIDYVTIGRYAIMGTGFYAPSMFFWYKWLDGKFPGTATPTILKKLVLDQFILTPYLLVLFYVGMSLMEGAENPFHELCVKFIPTFKTSCAFWLPAQTLNFSLVPPKARVVYMGVCGFIWVNILCFMKRQRFPNPEK